MAYSEAELKSNGFFKSNETPTWCNTAQCCIKLVFPQCCIKLVFHLTYTMMHGSTKLKFSDAKQGRETYNYKNIKRKLYRTNAAIWYNKICRQTQLTPAYINIRIKGKNQQCQNTLITVSHQVGVSTVSHQVGVSFDLYYDARKHKIKRILCFRPFRVGNVSDKSNETPTWWDTVQVLFLQSHSTCFGRKRPSSGVFKTGMAATGTCVIVAGKSPHLLIRAEFQP